jgi:ankyrin repeat protein
MLSDIEIALNKGDAAAVARILEADPSQVGHYPPGKEWQTTPLHHAADTGNIEIAKVLLSKGADIEARNGDGLTPLHMAVASGRPKMVRFLLGQGADIEATNEQGDTPLLWGALMGDWVTSHEAIKVLIQRGANLQARNWDGLNAMELAGEGWNQKVIPLLRRHGLEPDLRAAIVMVWPTKVRAMLKADPNAVRNTRKPDRLVSHATFMMEELIRRHGRKDPLLGIPKDEADLRKRRRITHEAIIEHLDILELLAQQGAPFDNESGNFALHKALQWPDPAMAEFLLEHGAPLKYGDDDRQIIHWAAEGNLYCPEEMLALLKRYQGKRRPRARSLRKQR